MKYTAIILLLLIGCKQSPPFTPAQQSYLDLKAKADSIRLAFELMKLEEIMKAVDAKVDSIKPYVYFDSTEVTKFPFRLVSRKDTLKLIN